MHHLPAALELIRVAVRPQHFPGLLDRDLFHPGHNRIGHFRPPIGTSLTLPFRGEEDELVAGESLGLADRNHRQQAENDRNRYDRPHGVTPRCSRCTEYSVLRTRYTKHSFRSLTSYFRLLPYFAGCVFAAT